MKNIPQPSQKNPDISILGENLDQESFPTLYGWAKSNPYTLSDTLQSMVDKMYKGDLKAVGSCMITLESDLAHENASSQ